MDGTAPASEIYFRDLHDFGFFFFLADFRNTSINLAIFSFDLKINRNIMFAVI